MRCIICFLKLYCDRKRMFVFRSLVFGLLVWYKFVGFVKWWGNILCRMNLKIGFKVLFYRLKFKRC